MRPIMMNFKFHLFRSSPRILFNLIYITKYLLAAKAKQDIEQKGFNKKVIEELLYEQDPETFEIYNTIDTTLPFTLREIKGP